MNGSVEGSRCLIYIRKRLCLYFSSGHWFTLVGTRPIDQTIWPAGLDQMHSEAPWTNAKETFTPDASFMPTSSSNISKHHLRWRHWKYSTNIFLVDCLQIHQPHPHHAPRSVASTHHGWVPSWGQINQQKSLRFYWIREKLNLLTIFSWLCQLWLLCRYCALILVLLLKKHIGLVSLTLLCFTQLHGTMKK